MSSASELRTLLETATIYEVVGYSDRNYLIFWFKDGSVCAARKRRSDSKAAARIELGVTKAFLDDCGVAEFRGTTYQKGTELLRQLQEGTAKVEATERQNTAQARVGRARSKYKPLQSFLQSVGPSESELTLSFSRIEDILGAPLPQSARKHRAWWSNPSSTDYHRHARAWLESGWRVDGVDQQEEWVRFRRMM
jgi:hypothetical protein